MKKYIVTMFCEEYPEGIIYGEFNHYQEAIAAITGTERDCGNKEVSRQTAGIITRISFGGALQCGVVDYFICG